MIVVIILIMIPNNDILHYILKIQCYPLLGNQLVVYWGLEQFTMIYNVGDCNIIYVIITYPSNFGDYNYNDPLISITLW